jgi:hypothetical protein
MMGIEFTEKAPFATVYISAWTSPRCSGWLSCANAPHLDFFLDSVHIANIFS